MLILDFLSELLQINFSGRLIFSWYTSQLSIQLNILVYKLANNNQNDRLFA